MNKHLIDKFSEIEGKTKTYLPNDVVNRSDNPNTKFNNVIVVSCYFTEEFERRYNNVVFYDSVSVEVINQSESAHFSFIINSSKEDSEDIILDIMNSSLFKP